MPRFRVMLSSPVLPPTKVLLSRVTIVAVSTPVVPTREVTPLEPVTVEKAKVLEGRELAGGFYVLHLSWSMPRSPFCDRTNIAYGWPDQICCKAEVFSLKLPSKSCK